MMKIKHIYANEILDSRGLPTVACSIVLSDGRIVESSVPSGASVGSREAHELRDGDENRFMGKGVLSAIKNIETIIAPMLIDKEPDLCAMDALMIAADGSKNKSVLGANSILAVSIAMARADAHNKGLGLFHFLQQRFKNSTLKMPQIMYNIINGGMHADNEILFQEFMIIPQFSTVAESVHCAVRVYQTLKTLLHKSHYFTTVGDEGGFAPVFTGKGKIKERMALDFLMKAIEKAGYQPGDDVLISLDVAATCFYDKKRGVYSFEGESLSGEDLVNVYKDLIDVYPIVSIEDGMSEDDVIGWKLMTKELCRKIQLVGDDVFVTSADAIVGGREMGIANAALIKPNQIGTVTEAQWAVESAHSVDFATVASHRSGETNDAFIVDFAVGCGILQLKAGAPARGERVAKYNRLLEIERIVESSGKI